MTTIKQQKFASIGSIYLIALYLFTQGYTWGRVNDALVAAAIGAISYTCGAGNIPGCAITAAASLLLVVFQAWNGGAPEGSQSASARRSDHLAVFHELGDGTVLDYIDDTKFLVGVDHKIWDAKGNVFRGSRHESGSPMMSIDLQEPTKLRGRSTGSINSFTVTYSATGTYTGDYTQANANGDANTLLTTYSSGKGSYMCASNSDDNGSSIEFSFTPTSPDGLYPRSGFAACSP